MAFTKKYLNEMFGTVLVLSALLSTVAAVDCHGKSFHCVNSTHFMICVDLGGGISHAIDNFLVACPPPTVCQGTNHFECEFPAPTTSSNNLSNVISDTTQPWEEVVTVSSIGNTTKEFSENYMNTERITTTIEYIVTTDKTVDLTAVTESELYVNNKLNIPQIVPTLAAEIATSAIETTQTLNENINITEYVPPEVTTVQITTAVLETVIQTTTEGKNLTDTGPVIVDEVTKPVAETTTENIIITDTVAAETGYKQRPEPIATEHVPQTIHENLNVTGTEPTIVAIDITMPIIETVSQSTTESGNLTETKHVVVDEFTTTTTETTTDSIIVTDPLTKELGYIESSATEQITLATNDNILELETVQSKTKPSQVTILLQNESAATNILSKKPPETQHKSPLNTEKRNSSSANNITANSLHKVSISKIKNASKTDSFVQNILPVQTTDTLETNVKTATGSIAHLTTIPVDKVTDDLSETTQPWEEAVTVSSIGNTTKEFSVNYVNTERITTTTEYIVTVDKTGDLTAANESELYVNNKFNIPEIVPTSAAVIATSAIETTQTLNENINITEYVPPEVTTVQITTAVVETVTQTTTESKNLTETGPVIVDEVTKPVAETTTENIIITDTVAAETGYKQRPEPIATEQTINITTTIIETVSQSTTESGNLTETKYVVVDELTTETTTDSIIITDPLRRGLGYIESTATEQITLTTNDNLLELETVQSKTKPSKVTILLQHESAATNILSEKPPKTQHKNPLNTEKRNSSTANNITANNLHKVSISKNKNASYTDSFVQNILPVETMDTLETNIKSATSSIANLTTIPVDKVTDDLITAASLDTTIKKSESVNVTEPSKPASSFVRSLRSNSSDVRNKQSAATKIETEETQMPTINDPKTPYNSVATRNRTEKVANRTEERDVVWNINSATSPVIVTTDVTHGHDAKENNLYRATDKSLNENKYSTVNNAPTEKTLIITTYTHNPEVAMVLDETWTETIDNGATTKQPTTINEGSLRTDTIQNLVTKYNIIVPTRQAVNLEILTTGLEPTIVSDSQLIPPAFEDNMNNVAQLSVNKNIISTVNNRDSTNGLMTVESVHKDTITTEVVDIPTTNSNAQPVTPFEDNMMTETSLPVTENILSTVNNEGSKHIFIAAQAVNMDTITTEALDIPTTVGNAHKTPPTFEDNMKIEISLPVTENILSTVNNGGSTNGFMTAQAVNIDTITTGAVGISTAISNTQSMLPAVKDNIKTEELFGNALATTTENIVLKKNNEVDKKDSINEQASDLNTISTDAIYLPTTVANGQTLAFIDIMKTEDPLSTTENIVSLINNGDSTNGFMTSQSINVDEVNMEVMYGTYTTISNAQSMQRTFEDDITTDTVLTTTGNIVSLVNYGVSTNNFTTAQPVSVDKLNTEPTHIPTTTLKAPTIEGHMRVDLPLPETGNILSSANNGASTNGFITTPAVNVDMINTQAKINKAPAMAPTFDDSTWTESPSPANKNIVSAINNGVTTNDLTTRKAGLETVVQLTTETHTGPASKVIELCLDNENAMETVHGDTITAESGTSVSEIIKSPNKAIQNIQTIIYTLANTAVDNAATSQKEASPINDNITRATTKTSINTFAFDSAFDISNQNLMNPQVESKTTQVNNNFQSSTIERNDQAANAGVDVSSVSTTLSANTSFADTTILDSLNPHEPINNSSSSSSGSSVIDTYKTLREPGSNAEVFLYHKDNMNAKSNQDPSITSNSIKSDNISEVKSSVIIVGNIDSPTVLNNNEIKLPTSSYALSEATGVETPMKGNKLNEEGRDDTLSKAVMLDVLPLPIHKIQLNVPAMNIPAIMDFLPKSQAKNTVIITESYKSATSRPNFVEAKIQNSVKVPTVPKIEDPAFNFQIGVSDEPGDNITFPAVGNSTSNSQTSVFAKTVARNGDATLNLQTKSIDEATALSQPSHVEKNMNKKTSATNNAHVIPDTKPVLSGTDTGNPHDIHTPTTSFNVNTGIIAPETVSYYDSQKSVNLTPQETVSSGLYQNSKSTVVTDIKSASQNVSFNTKISQQKSTGNNKIQNEVTHQNNSSTSITSSLSTQTQNIYTSTARAPSQNVTPNTISHVNDNRNTQIPTDGSQTFACMSGARGRYSDKNDCRKYYICIGNNEPIVGYCPEPSVFSDIKKLCTKNMSHCIRENQFKCPSAGRFSDFTKDNVYYICINHKTKFYRFKFQCQKGYILDKTTVHCIDTKEIESNESVSISSSDNSSQTSSSSISSSKSISTRSKLDDSSSNNDNSSTSKKSNEAVETTEKSEGNDDDDDDDDDKVFKCKKEGKFPIRDECTRYYLCKKNRKSEYRRKIKKCNSGKVFHKDKKKCVDDDSYEC